MDDIEVLDKTEVEAIEYDAEAIICGETYDVKVVQSPDHNGICIVDVFFDSGFVERLGVNRKNIFPKMIEKLIVN